MTAEQMFSRLGYVLFRDDENEIVYRKHLTGAQNKEIKINRESKLVETRKMKGNFGRPEHFYMTDREVDAVVQAIKELEGRV